MFQATKALKKISKLNKKIRAVSGGTGASKTFSIVMILIDYCQTNFNEKVDVVSETMPHLKDGVMKDFQQIMVTHGYWKDSDWNSTDKVYTFETGTKMKFLAFDKLGKAHGPRRDVLFLNECNFMSFKTVDQLITRTKKIVWLDWNPSEDFWFYDEYLPNRKDIDFIGEGGNYPPLTYKDNQGLSKEEVDEIESHRYNKAWWTVYGEGKRGEIQGRIYHNWPTVDEVPDNARLERRWVDFGYTNDPTAIGEIYYHDGRWLLNETLYLKGLSNKQIADHFLSLEKPQTLIVADSAEPKSIDELRAYGLNVTPAVKGKDSVMAGIQIIQDQPISVTKNSINIIKENRNYLFMVDKNGKILNEPDPMCADHHMDGIRYALPTLGRLKQEASYWDRVWEDELNPQPAKHNLGR